MQALELVLNHTIILPHLLKTFLTQFVTCGLVVDKVVWTENRVVAQRVQFSGQKAEPFVASNGFHVCVSEELSVGNELCDSHRDG